MKIHPDILKIKKTIISTRRDFHKYPELSFQEKRTSKIVAEKLESFGLKVNRNIGKTGVVGILKGKQKGKTQKDLKTNLNANSERMPVILDILKQNPVLIVLLIGYLIFLIKTVFDNSNPIPFRFKTITVVSFRLILGFIFTTFLTLVI